MRKTKIRRSPWSPDSWGAALSRQIDKASAEEQWVLQAFAEWLTKQRGTGPQTSRQRVDSVATFLTAMRRRLSLPCRQALASLRAARIEEFFVDYGREHGARTRQCMGTALRLFLRFAASRGWVGEDLAGAVPRLLVWRLSGLPRGLSEEDLATLLAWRWGSSECWRRDRAILELLATYGVRCGQVSALRLCDVDWRGRTIGFPAHKGGKAIQHGLTARVAQFLAEYLRDERPAEDGPYLFLRARRPYLRLSPMAITALVRRRMVRCGLPPRGPHALRHTFATRLLRSGQPIKTLADLLGHRSLDSIAIYAKVDFPRLLEVAGEWPEVLS